MHAQALLSLMHLFCSRAALSTALHVCLRSQQGPLVASACWAAVSAPKWNPFPDTNQVRKHAHPAHHTASHAT